MIVKLAGVALDARMQRRTDLRALARTSRWVAGNALALRDRRVFACGAMAEPAITRVRADGFGELLAALSLAPSLIAPEDLPARWRFALRVLGIPTLGGFASAALAQGIPVLTLSPFAPWTIEVERQDRCYVARITRAPQLLAA
jgi:hypothetical protein